MNLVGIKHHIKAVGMPGERSRVMVVYCLTDVGGNMFPPNSYMIQWWLLCNIQTICNINILIIVLPCI